MTRPRSSGVLAFEARLSDEISGTRSLIWRSGSIEVVELNSRLLPGREREIVSDLFPLENGADGRILLRAALCCDSAYSEALLLTGPTQTSRHYLPFLAEGQFPPRLSYRTLVRNANPSPYTALYDNTLVRDGLLAGAESRSETRNAQPAPRPRPALFPAELDILGSGRVDQYDFQNQPGRGVLRIDTLQGGPLAFYGLIQLQQDGQLISQTSLEPQTPLQEAQIVIDRSTGNRVGFAVTNPGETMLVIDWQLIDQHADPLDSGTFELPPHAQISQFVDEIVPGLPEPFLGTLLLTGENDPFLAVGLRQNGLKLSTIPIQTGTPAPPPYGFALLVPSRPQQELDPGPRQVRLGPNEEQAIVTREGQLQLISRAEFQVLFGPGHPLEEAGFSSNSPNDVEIAEFGPAGLLFFISPGIGRPGLFLWDENGVRRLVRNGEMLDGGIQIGLRGYPEGLAMNDSGQIAMGANALFLREPDGEVIPLLDETDLLPGGSETFGPIEKVAINESGTVGFITRRAVGLAKPGALTVVAQLESPIRSDFLPESFENVRITSDDHVYFTATSSRLESNQPQGVSAPVQTSGLFFFDGSALHSLLVTGDPLSEDETILVDQVANRNLDSEHFSSIRLNHQDELVASATLDGGLGNSVGSFLLSANTASQPSLLVTDFRLDPSFPGRVGSEYAWNDRGELLFEGSLLPFRDALFKRLPGGQFEQVLVQGDRLDVSDVEQPRVAYSTRRVWDLSNRGSLAFGASVFPDFGVSTYLARPEGFNQLWVPQVVSGSFGELAFSSALLLHNRGPGPARVSVDAYSASGVRKLEVPEMTLTPGQSERIELEFAEPMTGWARLQIRGGTIGAFLRLSVRDGHGILSELTVPAVTARWSAFWRAGRVPIQNRNTGLALVNTAYSTSEVTIERLGPGLIPRDLRRLVLPPGGYRALLLTDLFPDLAFEIGDDLYRISSQNPMAIFSMEQLQGQVTPVPLMR